MGNCECASNNDGQIDWDCEECLKDYEKAHQEHYREYMLYHGHDDEGNIIDVRTNEIVVKK